MFRLHIFMLFFISPAIVTAKLHGFTDIFSENVTGIESSEYEAYEKEILWVLEFGDEIWDSLNVRQGNDIDKDNFKTYAAPMIERHLKTRSKVVKKDSAKLFTTIKPRLSQEDPKEVKTKLFQIINKIVFKYYAPNPDVLANYTKFPLKLYFKGLFTVLIIEHDIRHWLFFIPPPSPLPLWFYQQHGNIVTGVTPDVVSIPDDVKLHFYPALLRLLRSLLAHPL